MYNYRHEKKLSDIIENVKKRDELEARLDEGSRKQDTREASREAPPEPLTEWLDGEEFHKLCMDYRGALLWGPDTPRECFERLQAAILRAALTRQGKPT